MKHIIKKEVNFERLQEALGPLTPLREHDDRYVSLAACDKEWSPRIVFCDRDCFLDDLSDCIEEVGIEPVLAAFISGTSYFSDWMKETGRA